MKIDWLNKESQEFLERGYLLPNQTVEERIKVIGDAAEKILGFEGYSEKLQTYISKGYISLSTPIWTNFGTDRGLPISCFGSYIGDSVESILYTAAEIGTQSKYGGGTSAYFGDIRGRGEVIKDNGESNGTKPFIGLFQEVSNTINQGNTRRGYFAGYIPIDHKDIEEWLSIRGEGDPIQQITWGICVPEGWLESMEAGDESKRIIWARVIQKRFETGLPYIFFTDNANNHISTPECYRSLNSIKASQMCTEIMLPSNLEETFVCDLLSYNDLLFEEYSKTDCVFVGACLLDAVMTEFIDKASKITFFERAVKFAKNHRAVGAGRLAYVSYLQSKMIPFESLEARHINIEIQKYIREESYKASKYLKEVFGPPEGYPDLDRRNTTLNTNPPTKSTAFILKQISESTEIPMSNYYTKDLAKGKFVIKNRYLEELLIKLDKNTEEVWESIKVNHGSVLHLDFLSDTEKLVFKTAKEVSQEEVIIQAAHRQNYIDQGQSLNLFISPDKTAKDVNKLILLAHKMGLKSLYYQHNTSAVQNLTKELTCVSCE